MPLTIALVHFITEHRKPKISHFSDSLSCPANLKDLIRHYKLICGRVLKSLVLVLIVMHRSLSIHRLISIIAISGLLASCSDPNDVVSICENNSAICQDLNSDKWCQSERDNLIISRFNLQQNTSEQNQYSLLTSLNDYQECIKIAALIEPRQHPELKTQRVAAMLSTYDELLAVEKDTLSSNNPYILNYHWQSHNNKNARQRFITLSKQQTFTDPLLYLALANIEDYNVDKSISHLLQGISLLDDDDDYNDNNKMTAKLLYGLITAYMQKRSYQRAYMWSHTAIMLDVENINLTLFNQHKIAQTEKARLEKLAQKLGKQIETQQFTAESYQQTLSTAGF